MYIGFDACHDLCSEHSHLTTATALSRGADVYLKDEETGI